MTIEQERAEQLYGPYDEKQKNAYLKGYSQCRQDLIKQLNKLKDMFKLMPHPEADSQSQFTEWQISGIESAIRSITPKEEDI